MRLSYIILRIREAQTGFGNYVAGSAELDLALRNTLKRNCAFVVPLMEDTAANQMDNGVNQIITEKFSVVVAVGNDSSDADKTGLTAYDLLHDIRSELFRSLVGWFIIGAEGPISYAGGKFVVIRNSYLWWQFDFQFSIRLREFDGYCDIDDQEGFYDKKQLSQLDSFDKISSKYITWPSANLPWQGTVSDVTSDITDMETWIDLTDDPDGGAFGRGFSSDFDFYRVLNRRNDPK